MTWGKLLNNDNNYRHVNNGDCYIPRLSLNKRSTVVDSWSHGPDQIQMYPNRDTILQLLPAPDVLLRLLQERSK